MANPMPVSTGLDIIGSSVITAVREIYTTGNSWGRIFSQ